MRIIEGRPSTCHRKSLKVAEIRRLMSMAVSIGADVPNRGNVVR